MSSSPVGSPARHSDRIPHMTATTDTITQTLQAAIPGARVFASSPDGVHFQAVVVSPSFEGLPLVAQHRLVMSALRGELDSNRVHAMQLKTMTPDQYRKAAQ